MQWDESGARRYESGVSKGVLYRINQSNQYTPGVPWNGLTSVSESPDGAEPNDLWADNIKYATLYSAETFGATVEAYTYPEEFEECDGSAEIADGVYLGQQARQPFGLCYRTEIGDDTNPERGYKLHLVYNATARPSDKDYETINDNPDAITFSWEISTIHVNVTGKKPASTIIIDSTKADATKLAALEEVLYGSTTYSAVADPSGKNPKSEGWYTENNGVYTPTNDTTPQSGTTYYSATTTDARLPLPDEIISMMS